MLKSSSFRISRGVSALLLVAMLVPGVSPYSIRAQEGGRTFPETGKTVKGPFMEYWNAHGGLAQQGYPISEEIREHSDTDGKTYTVQYFERAVFELHPENKPPHDVLLSLLGALRYEQKYPDGAVGQTANSEPNSRLFRETGKRVGGVFRDYWLGNGGLMQQGYPISDELTERSELDGKEYRVQYFERAVFEHHPENRPPYNVLLSQLGTFRHKAMHSASVTTGTLKATRGMSVARSCHTSTLLPSGKVLVAGGMLREPVFTASAELYDPTTDTFSPTGSMLTARACHSVTLLPNGKVLVAGGSNTGWLRSAELYDPATGKFEETGSWNIERRGGFTATLLRDGRVLFAGGYDAGQRSYLEIYDPASGNFSVIARMPTLRSAHTATLLRSGKVLLTGGGTEGNVLASAEIFNPATGAIAPAASMAAVRYKHAATLLPDGRVLIVGGSDARDWRGRHTSAEVYEPSTGKFELAGSMASPRFKISDATALLRDGRLLVSGAATRIEIFDPASGTFAATEGEMDAGRFYSTATALPDGRALITGGYGYDIRATNRAWIYEP
jgi:hypothetical protein